MFYLIVFCSSVDLVASTVYPLLNFSLYIILKKKSVITTLLQSIQAIITKTKI